MIAFLAGFIIALFLYYSTSFGWFLIPIFWTCALLLQVVHARSLNAFLGGIDPVREFGARNLRQLRAVLPIPLPISLASFAARVLSWAGLVAILISVGWLRIS